MPVSFDNRSGKRKVNTPTFSISVEGVDFCYTYIRKNACTSFKRLFKHYSQHDFLSAGGDLKGMAKFHLVRSSGEATKLQNRVFVYRHPLERVVSVFNNKFIQRLGATDIFKDFTKVVGRSPESCTFKEFVKNYVSHIEKNNLIDAHLLPQSWHLYPILYTHAIKLSDVESGMSSILGESVGQKFFSKPVNSTSHVEKISIEGAENLPASELVKIYESRGQLPEFTSYMTNDISDVLCSIYSDDISMLSKIS